MKSILSAVLCVLPLVLQTAYGCSCMWGIHTQTKFCNSDYALTGTVKSMSNDLDDWRYNGWRYFTVEVDRVYKEPSDALIGSEAIIKTGGNDAMCGVMLQVNTTVFVSGHVLSDGQLAMNSCGWITPSEHLTLQQLKGLEGEYAKNCNCKIGNQWYIEEEFQCRHRDSQNTIGCLDNHSYCGLVEQLGQCTWVVDHTNKECQKRGKRNLKDLLLKNSS